MSTDIGVIVVSFLPNCAAYWFIYQLFLNRRDLRSKQFGYIEFWCGLIGLLYLYFSIVALVMLSFFSEKDIVDLILLVGLIASGLIVYIYAGETSAREGVIEARERYISDNSAAIDKFPEYIGKSLAVQDIVKAARIPEGFVGPVTAVLESHVDVVQGITRTELIAKLREAENPRYVLEYALAEQMPGKVPVQDIANEIFMLFMEAPKVLAYAPDGVPLRQFVYIRRGSTLSKELAEKLLSIPASLTLPDTLRTSHMHVVAGSGAGKTQLFQSLILDDLETDAAIVVIDSQGDLINGLAQHVPEDRLILIDPETCPPSLNIFSGKDKGERSVATAIELYEYIFSALDAQMTSKQSTAYRFLSRLLLAIPGANIHTMREILEPNGTAQYTQYIDEMGDTARSFFRNEFDNTKQFGETRQQILRRLYTVLENDTFSKMLGAPDNKLDMTAALDSGKVILINTAKPYLKQTSASLFGRIFIAQVMQSVMERGTHRRRTYLYIDEFQDYAEDSHVLFNMFEQSRKYGLGLIVAHQFLGQLPMKLAASISANTAIKFASGVSSNDVKVLAGQMRTEPYNIERLPKGTFMAWFKDLGAMSWPVELGRMEKMPPRNDLKSIQALMRDRYGVTEPRKAKIVFRKAKDVEEKGKW